MSAEMKQNAEAISARADSGARILYRINEEVQALVPGRTRLRLIGHSAGAIVHSHVVDALAPAGWQFETVNFMAPAVTMQAFGNLVVPHLSKAVKRYNEVHLTNTAEEKDPTCHPVLRYSRSLLYLVSGTFEDTRNKPILGMEKFFRPRPGMQAFAAPGAKSASTTQGGFDDDALTVASVIELIKARSTARSTATGRVRTRRRRRKGGMTASLRAT
jgi:hypothetical protein